MIPYSRQHLTEDDISAVVEVLKSDLLTQGPIVPQFEERLANYCQAKHSVAVSSGTAALHVACLALGIGQSDIVWVSAVSFVASANCAAYCNATIKFIDVQADSGLICPQALHQELALAKQAGQLPKLLIVVHLAGQVCDMQAIAAICLSFRIRIIEDASHALSSRYQHRPVGCCEYSDIAVFSFHPVKPITCGEGGALTTNCRLLADNARKFASHGIEKRLEHFLYASPGPWYYEQHELGYNYRLSDIHAALGCSQLGRLDEALAERTRLATLYDRHLENLQVSVQARSTDCQSSFHLYILLLQNTEQRERVFLNLRDLGYGVNLHYLLIPDQPFYKSKGNDGHQFPGAQKYSSRAVSLPLHVGLPASVIEDVVASIASSL